MAISRLSDTVDKKEMIDHAETHGMTPAQIEQYKEAERLIAQWRELGVRASKLLYSARDGIAGIDWFDHRHHMLNPSVEFTDFWTLSGDNAVSKMPLDSTVLDLCCGDGFYDYYFYRNRAASIKAVDISAQAIALARREHAAPNIEYMVCDVRTWAFGGPYDVVICRGAIEHFTESEQRDIFARVNDSLKPYGWFCGDTVTPVAGNLAHKCEWADEHEMINALGAVFDFVDVETVVSRGRTTLLWRCQKC